MITTTVPTDWKDLQRVVGQILAECGFAVEVEKQVATVRGGVELDVWAEEDLKGRKYQTVCECKLWKARVPQNVVHGFRTVLGDIGAHVGYIISTSGFQDGAFEAAANTNVRLVTWEEFQSEFEATWYRNFMSPEIAKRLDALLSYTEPLLPLWFRDLPPDSQQAYLDLKHRYDEFGWVVMSFTPYHRIASGDNIPTLPVIEHLPEGSAVLQNVPESVLQAKGLRDFLEEATLFGQQVIEKFQAFRPGVD